MDLPIENGWIFQFVMQTFTRPGMRLMFNIAIENGTSCGDHHPLANMYIYIYIYLIGGLEHEMFDFLYIYIYYIGNFIIPTYFHIFQRGCFTTNQIMRFMFFG